MSDNRTVFPKMTANYSHDPAAFTEGLFWRSGFLYESTGLADVTGCCSSLRRVDLKTGRVLQERNLTADIFAEGITVVDGQDGSKGESIVQLTYQSGRGYTYDFESFKPEINFSLPANLESHEGWGLTQNGTHLIMSDGTAWLYFLDPSSLREVHRQAVFWNGVPLEYLNELEWDPHNQELLANLWYEDYWKIARIDIKTGTVVGWYDFSVLKMVDVGDHDVFNGIAVDESIGNLIVTGKCFNQVFVTKIVNWPKLVYNET